jgi:hypothetical protein
MDNETLTEATAEAVPAQRSAGGTDAAAPLAGCQCRDCQGARFV